MYRLHLLHVVCLVNSGFDGPGLVRTSCCSGVQLKTFFSLLLFPLLRGGQSCSAEVHELIALREHLLPLSVLIAAGLAHLVA